jgi:hypothetical protein
MKLIEAIKVMGRPVEVPDCSRNDLPELFKELGFKVGVEIGTYLGTYAEIIAKSGLQIYTVDPWAIHEDYPHYSNPKFQGKLEQQYLESKARLAPYPNCTIIRKTSMEASKDFKNGSIDFVYIDGNHAFKYVAEDICEWSKKVKKGGIISGHDYIYARPTNFHVHQVVDAYVEALGIRNFWILGRKKYVKGEKRDNWRSWMWFNP